MEVLTLDRDPGLNPDIVWDLNKLPYSFAPPNSFDLIVAEEVLEHTGAQGDERFFFSQFGEIWNILRPGGVLGITVPRWDREWSLGDPGHRRVFTLGTFAFLDTESESFEQIGRTAMTDYRPLLGGQRWKAYGYYTEGNLIVSLTAVKD